MNPTFEYKKPSKKERLLAKESLQQLKSSINNLSSKEPKIEIEIEETKESIKIPFAAINFLVDILETMKKGLPVSIVPHAIELTTQKAAEFLGCSRPHLVKLLDNKSINHTYVGRHRRVKFEDLMKYKKSMKDKQKGALINLMNHTKEAQ